MSSNQSEYLTEEEAEKLNLTDDISRGFSKTVILKESVGMADTTKTEKQTGLSLHESVAISDFTKLSHTTPRYHLLLKIQLHTPRLL